MKTTTRCSALERRISKALLEAAMCVCEALDEGHDTAGLEPVSRHLAAALEAAVELNARLRAANPDV